MYKLWTKAIDARKNDLKDMVNTHTFNTFYIKEQIYDTHDNGGRPFTVKIGNYGIRVYVGSGQMIHFIKESCGYWGGFDSSPYKMHGNSILVKLSDTEYVFIGHNITVFHTNDIITDYVSPVGNSDVLYPVCYGTKYTYFMLDMKKLPNEDIKATKIPINTYDIYIEFYNTGEEKKLNIEHKVLVKRQF